MSHLNCIVAVWKDLGLQLGLKLEELNAIEAAPLHIHGGPAAFLREVLHKWLKGLPPSHTRPTLSELCEALRSPAVKEHRVADDLEQQYQARSTGL